MNPTLLLQHFDRISEAPDAHPAPPAIHSGFGRARQARPARSE